MCIYSVCEGSQQSGQGHATPKRKKWMYKSTPTVVTQSSCHYTACRRLLPVLCGQNQRTSKAFDIFDIDSRRHPAHGSNFAFPLIFLLRIWESASFVTSVRRILTSRRCTCRSEHNSLMNSSVVMRSKIIWSCRWLVGCCDDCVALWVEPGRPRAISPLPTTDRHHTPKAGKIAFYLCIVTRESGPVREVEGVLDDDEIHVRHRGPVPAGRIWVGMCGIGKLTGLWDLHTRDTHRSCLETHHMSNASRPS